MYSNITKRSTSAQFSSLPEMTSVSPNTHIARPGTFDEEVNKMFKLNNLPPIKTLSNPPSQEILNIMSKQHESNMEMAGARGNNDKPTQKETRDKERETKVLTVDEGERTETRRKIEANTLEESMMDQGRRKYSVKGGG